MAPVFAARLFPRLERPLDFGLKWFGRRILGSHKTVRGLVSGVLAAGVVYFLQLKTLELNPDWRSAIAVPVASLPSWFGFWMGFCVLLGDAVKSLFKRWRGIRPGGTWIPFDQIDWVLGALLGALPFAKFSPAGVAMILFFGFGVSLSAHFLGYLLGLNTDPL